LPVIEPEVNELDMPEVDLSVRSRVMSAVSSSRRGGEYHPSLSVSL
jgi:hypothetical protein